jgi:hypothetical protein
MDSRPGQQSRAASSSPPSAAAPNAGLCPDRRGREPHQRAQGTALAVGLATPTPAPQIHCTTQPNSGTPRPRPLQSHLSARHTSRHSHVTHVPPARRLCRAASPAMPSAPSTRCSRSWMRCAASQTCYYSRPPTSHRRVVLTIPPRSIMLYPTLTQARSRLGGSVWSGQLTQYPDRAAQQGQLWREAKGREGCAAPSRRAASPTDLSFLWRAGD